MRLMNFVMIGILGCDAGQTKPAPATPPPVPTAPPPADASRAEPAPVPPSLKAAPAWVGRRLMTGAVRTKHTHHTFTLRREGNQALLTVELRDGKGVAGSSITEIEKWNPVSVTEYLGTIEDKDDIVTIAVAHGSDRLDFECKRTTVVAAPADALRDRAQPRATDCVGDQGRWVPKATKRVDVIRCIPFEEPDLKDEDAIDEWEKLAFAPHPGIEWLHVNDDCIIQGGGWRLVAADGAIAGIRVPKLREKMR